MRAQFLKTVGLLFNFLVAFLANQRVTLTNLTFLLFKTLPFINDARLTLFCIYGLFLVSFSKGYQIILFKKKQEFNTENVKIQITSKLNINIKLQSYNCTNRKREEKSFL